MIRRLTLPVPGEDLLERIARRSRLGKLKVGRPRWELIRETYFDTADHILRERGMVLLLRMEATGRQVAMLRIEEAVNLQGVVEETVLEAPIVAGGLYATLLGTSDVATRVRKAVNPAALRPQLALDIDREFRDLRRGWLPRGPAHRAALDRIVAHAPDFNRHYEQLSLIEVIHGAKPSLEALAAEVTEEFGLEQDGLDLPDRVRRDLGVTVDHARADGPMEIRMGLLLMREGEVALTPTAKGLCLPRTRGSGEDLARAFLRELATDAASDAEIDLVGFAQGRDRAGDIEVWLHQAGPAEDDDGSLIWMPLVELLERVGGPRLLHPDLLACLVLLVRSEIGLRLLREAPQSQGPPKVLEPGPRNPDLKPGKGAEDILNKELSILDFNLRVLELAEDLSVPLLERFRFLSIFSMNMDEFFVVRVGRLKVEAHTEEGEKAQEATDLLDRIAVRVRAYMARQYACLQQVLLPLLAEEGVRLRTWDGLGPEEREGLAHRFQNEIFPLLTPRSMSAAPGHPFPRMASLGLSLAVILEEKDGDGQHFAHVPIPEELPRFLRVPGGDDLIPVEDVVVGNARGLFPAYQVREAHSFRVSRIGDVEIDEDASDSFLAAIADEVEARPYKPVVRLEVQRTMPREVRAHLLRELRAEGGTDLAVLTRSDVYELDGAIDLGGFAELADLELAGHHYEPYEPARPLEDYDSIFDALKEDDVLVHHPYDAFSTTVGRFLTEAADDPDVVGIKLTLYRTGKDSPVMDALLRALEQGKDVSVFVELKARFDEESNIEWTRRLAESGGHVVYGLVGYKTHAKTALVVRRENGGFRRYVHIGTGNYNAVTARFYTDLGLMSADPDLGADLNDFFNELTGSSGPPVKEYRQLLVAPTSLMPELVRRIEREAANAKAGRPARIQAKLNGLADKKIIKALYRASRAGVEIDLIVRSICTLRPGVPSLSENIRVRSILGRFLEHARVYYFENGGDGEYFIGSADWRARNLRRRVEVVSPVLDARLRKGLRRLLDTELANPRAWVLRADGSYERLNGEGRGSQEEFLAIRESE